MRLELVRLAERIGVAFKVDVSFLLVPSSLAGRLRWTGVDDHVATIDQPVSSSSRYPFAISCQLTSLMEALSKSE